MDLQILTKTTKKEQKYLTDFIADYWFKFGNDAIATLMTDHPDSYAWGDGSKPINRKISSFFFNMWFPGKEDKGKAICFVMKPPTTEKEVAESNDPVCCLAAEVNTPKHYIDELKFTRGENVSFKYMLKRVCSGSLIGFIRMMLSEVHSETRHMKRMGFTDKSQLPENVYVLSSSTIWHGLMGVRAVNLMDIYKCIEKSDTDSRILKIRLNILCKKEHKKKGYEAELVEAAVNYAKQEKIEHIMANCYHKNTKIYEDLGFNLIGYNDFEQYLGVLVPDNRINREVVRVHKGYSWYYLKLYF